ncbi:uncharacterized protein BO87DRAFT_400561 [Aspergillus neoniger CBS 115656]|uniref:Uncharacterized protein n=1 Tax=Aspergillus neoniger (strain CBS 115656) TaxID=1448310 RepID=A0A318Y7Q1_ASPNB|nr:hypothetical protein BO87DRAFT_400561 [Aspergillus neoniger CBS 115656]PYH30316.1 hypothetical protein BO87DRAFT_400561 [Aspergillus neoniger CBS 115656]
MNGKAAVLRRKLSPVGAIVDTDRISEAISLHETVTVGTFHHGTAAKYCGHGDTADGSTGTSGHSMIPASGEFGDYILESVAEKLLDGIRNGIGGQNSHDTLPSPPSTGAEITSAYANPQIIDFQIILNLGGLKVIMVIFVCVVHLAIRLLFPGLLYIMCVSPDPIDCNPTATT